MKTTVYRGYPITEENSKWSVDLGIKYGRKYFNSLNEAKQAIDKRCQEIENETLTRP